MLFWSGFEEGVSVGAPQDFYGNGAFQSVHGTDSTTGFAWPPVVVDNPGSTRFQLITNSGSAPNASTVSDFMVNEIQTTPGHHNGAQTKALLSWIKKSGCCGTNPQAGGSTQIAYQIKDSDVGQLYQSFWVKFQDDLEYQMRNGTWRCLWELKSSDTDIRYQLCFDSNPMRWWVRMDGWPNGASSHKDYWRPPHTNVAVVGGKWTKVEVFYRRSSGNDGRLWFAIDGTVIGERAGWNIGENGSPINRDMVITYSGGYYPVSQWIDDWQIWSTFPTASVGDPWYDPPYAPH